MHPLALADEEFDAEIVLQLPDAGGDVGLHAVEFFRRARDAALGDDGAENGQIGQIHRSLTEIDLILIIHFI